MLAMGGWCRGRVCARSSWLDEAEVQVDREAPGQPIDVRPRLPHHVTPPPASTRGISRRSHSLTATSAPPVALQAFSATITASPSSILCSSHHGLPPAHLKPHHVRHLRPSRAIPVGYRRGIPGRLDSYPRQQHLPRASSRAHTSSALLLLLTVTTLRRIAHKPRR